MNSNGPNNYNNYNNNGSHYHRGGGGNGGNNNDYRDNSYNNNYNNNMSNGYSNNNGDRGGGGGGGGFRNNNNNNQGYSNNRYNNNNNKSNLPNNGNNGGNNMNSNQHNNMMGNNNNKDLAPRFKRNMMGGAGAGSGGGGNNSSGGGGGPGGNSPTNSNHSSGNNSSGDRGGSSAQSQGNNGGNNGDNVENLQMRPAANSLLFKANTMNVNKQQLPLSQPQQRVIPTNSMLAMNNANTAGQNSGSNQFQNRESTNSSPFRQQSPNQFGERYINAPNTQSYNQREAAAVQMANEREKDRAELKAQAAAEQKAASESNSNSTVLKPTPKAKKKDKGPNKEEIVKKFATFLQEVYLQKFVASIVEEKEEEIVVEEKKETAEEIEVKETTEKVEKIEEEKETVTKTEENIETKAEEGDKKEDTEKTDETKKDEEVSVVVEDKEEVKKLEPKPEEPQTLNEITKKFIDLKVPEKFLKDCLTNLLAEVLEKSQENTNEGKLEYVKEDEIDVNKYWGLTPEERCIFFIAQVKRDAKMSQNAINEAFKQTVQTLNEPEATIPKISDLLTHAVLKKVLSLSEIAAMTENGKNHPLILVVLQRLHLTIDKKALTELFNGSKVNLINCLPEVDRNKDKMAAILDERNLAFLYPLLKVQAELWKQIQIDSNPQQFYKWIKENVDPTCLTEPGFVTALMTVLLKHITQVRRIVKIIGFGMGFKESILCF